MKEFLIVRPLLKAIHTCHQISVMMSIIQPLQNAIKVIHMHTAREYMQYLILDKSRIVLEHEEVVDVIYTLPPKAVTTEKARSYF